MTDILQGGDGQADSSIVEAEESPEHLLGQAGDDDAVSSCHSKLNFK